AWSVEEHTPAVRGKADRPINRATDVSPFPFTDERGPTNVLSKGRQPMKTPHSFVARSIVTGMTAWGAGSYEARAQGRSAGGGQRSPGASPFRPATQPRGDLSDRALLQRNESRYS